MRRILLPILGVICLCACATAPKDAGGFAAAYFAGHTGTPPPDKAVLVLTDMRDTIVYTTPEFEKITRYSKADLAGQNFYRMPIYMDSFRPDQAAVKHSLETNAPVTIPQDLITSEGMLVGTTVIVEVIKDAAGNPVGVSRSYRVNLIL